MHNVWLYMPVLPYDSISILLAQVAFPPALGHAARVFIEMAALAWPFRLDL